MHCPIMLVNMNVLSSNLRPGCSFSAYVCSLSPAARPNLELLLDWGHDGVDRDLIEIAHHMLHWEEKLCSHLGLTAVDIHDIKAIHHNKPELQR